MWWFNFLFQTLVARKITRTRIGEARKKNKDKNGMLEAAIVRIFSHSLFFLMLSRDIPFLYLSFVFQTTAVLELAQQDEVLWVAVLVE